MRIHSLFTPSSEPNSHPAHGAGGSGASEGARAHGGAEQQLPAKDGHLHPAPLGGYPGPETLIWGGTAPAIPRVLPEPQRARSCRQRTMNICKHSIIYENAPVGHRHQE